MVDLSQIRGVPEKLEGIAIIDAQTVAVANDNDFDIKSFSDSLRANRPAKESGHPGHPAQPAAAGLSLTSVRFSVRHVAK